MPTQQTMSTKETRAFSPRRMDELHRGTVVPLMSSIAPPEGPISSSEHAVGEFITFDYKLYKVTSPISEGDALAEGTNIQRTNVVSEMGGGGGGGTIGTFVFNPDTRHLSIVGGSLVYSYDAATRHITIN